MWNSKTVNLHQTSQCLDSQSKQAVSRWTTQIYWDFRLFWGDISWFFVFFFSHAFCEPHQPVTELFPPFPRQIFGLFYFIIYLGRTPARPEKKGQYLRTETPDYHWRPVVGRDTFSPLAPARGPPPKTGVACQYLPLFMVSKIPTRSIRIGIASGIHGWQKMGISYFSSNQLVPYPSQTG